MRIFGKIASLCFNIARIACDLKAWTSGDPRKVVRRLLNKRLGKSVHRRAQFRGR